MSSLSPASSTALGLSQGPQLAVRGLVSGMDTDKLIEGLLAIQQQRTLVIQQRHDRVQQVQAAFKGVEARLLSFQARLTPLARSQNGAFDARTVASGDESILTAAGSSSAVPGTYSVRVDRLATAHQLASQGFDSATSLVTQGTFQLRVGDAASATVTIDSTNNTLQGLAAAINATGLGVNATVVNDGSGAEAYRLVLGSRSTGTAGRIAITNGLAGSAAGAVKPVFDAPSVGQAVRAAGYTGTSVPSVAGGTAYTGTTNNTYRFTVVAGGTVGTDDKLQVAFADSSGAHTGTLTLNAADVDVPKDVAQGLRVQFASGTLVAGQSFTVKAYVPVVQEPADALVTVGSGAGALTVASSTNQVEGLIPGVTLQLRRADVTRPVSITVTADTAKAKEAIQDFVTAFNDLMKYIDEQVRYDPETRKAGLLLGDRRAIAVQDQVRSAAMAAVAGTSQQMNRLSALGITADDQGRLVVNDAKLTDALEGRRAGVTLADVRKLFALAGSSPNAGVQFVGGSTKTKAGDYQVQLTQTAAQASITAANALAASTTIDGTNNVLAITVDGATASSVQLPQGTYDAQTLAQVVQAAVNSAPALAGRRVSVAVQGGKLNITSASFGSASKLSVGAGSANAPLGFAGAETGTGRDVAGNFLVGATSEPAVGTGQFLMGSAGNANTADLQLRVTLNAAQVGAGLTAPVSVTRGLASALDLTLNGLLDPVSGRMKSLNDGYKDALEDLQRQKEQQTARVDAQRNSLLRQFAAMERTLSQLQSAGSFLAGQLVNTQK